MSHVGLTASFSCHGSRRTCASQQNLLLLPLWAAEVKLQCAWYFPLTFSSCLIFRTISLLLAASLRHHLGHSSLALCIKYLLCQSVCLQSGFIFRVMTYNSKPAWLIFFLLSRKTQLGVIPQKNNCSITWESNLGHIVSKSVALR